ncbi:MAG: hypothetical protein ACRDHN_12605, partial [Thermomicrobiales bacterium]
AALGCPHLGVRPLEERVPAAIENTAAGQIFSRLVRMTDGPSHQPLRSAVETALDSLDPELIVKICREAVRLLLPIESSAIEQYLFDVPVYAIGRLLGIPDTVLPHTANLMRRFVRCFSPLSTTEQITQGIATAQPLLEIVKSGLAGPLYTALENAMREAGCDLERDLPANAIGLIFQSYEGTAGLIGNAIKRMPTHSGSIRALLLESLQLDSAVQNTRRFAHKASSIGENSLESGDRVLVVLAAANLDAQTPDFSFGFGAHSCPGRELALTIAEIGLSELVAAGFDFTSIRFSGEYRPSANTRIPIFESTGGHA